MTSQRMASFSEELLPGIAHDVTLTHIATKLPWTALHKLSSVSKSWQRAIQSREVYRERIRCHAAEELAVLITWRKYGAPGDNELYKHTVSLYSVRQKAFYDLPPIPGFQRRNLHFCQSVASNGKLYVCSHDWISSTFEERQVYVLDVVGQGQWKECTSCQRDESTLSIGCNFNLARKHNFVADECPDWFNSSWQTCKSRGQGGLPSPEMPPRNPGWGYTGDPRGVIGERRRYLMQVPHIGIPKIYVQDINTKLWTHLHSISYDETARQDAPEPTIVFLVNNELLTVTRWRRDSTRPVEFLQSKGFGTESRRIVWERIPTSFRVCGFMLLGVCPILL